MSAKHGETLRNVFDLSERTEAQRLEKAARLRTLAAFALKWAWSLDPSGEK